MACFRCGKELDELDIGCYLKLVNRGAETYLCRACLGADIGWTSADFDRAIRRFREQGCKLFPPLEDGD